MVNRLRGVPAPCERAVAVTNHSGHCHRIDVPVLECLNDDFAGVCLVVLLQLGGGEMPGAGNGAVEIVRVGGAVTGNVLSGLCPRHREGAVGVDDAAQRRKCLVQLQMGLCITAGIERAFHDGSRLQIHHHHFVRGQFLILHAGGLDDHQPAGPVDTGHIAPCVGDQPTAGQFHVGLIDLLFECLQHHSTSTAVRSTRSTCL